MGRFSWASDLGSGIKKGWNKTVDAVKGLDLNPFNDDEQAKADRLAAMDTAHVELDTLKTQQRAQREIDLQRALAYFGPVQAELDRLYRPAVPGTSPMPGPMGPPVPSLPAPSSAQLRSVENMMAPTRRPGQRGGLKY